jgi:hypothetical protein
MKAFLIDAAAREVRAVGYAGLDDLRKLVGGWITVAQSWETGDTCYVDDEGLFKPQAHFFRLCDREQPLAGNGVVVGPERTDDEGEYLTTDDPTMTAEEIAAVVQFMDRAQADSWGKANASEPAISISSLDAGGAEGDRQVLTRIGKLFGDMPRPADEDDRR